MYKADTQRISTRINTLALATKCGMSLYLLAAIYIEYWMEMSI